MVYLGSKRKYCKDIVPIIQKYIDENNITTFIDVFCGGANLADKIKCDTVIANDLSPSLIALHKQAQLDFSQIPKSCDREDWDAAKNEFYKIIREAVKNNETPITTLPLYKIGAIEWYASYSNGGFSRGYAKNSPTRNYYREAYNNHKNQAENPNYQKIIFTQGDYKNINIPSDKVLLYCDSPYKNTTPYDISKHFNFEEYYEWLRETSKKYPIFISEQNMPDDFNKIWEKEANRTTSKTNRCKAVECLFFRYDKQ